MRTNASATLKTMALFAAAVSVMLTALPASAMDGTADCDPATCTSPVLGPGHHQDVDRVDTVSRRQHN
jgi:hypothetical protein